MEEYTTVTNTTDNLLTDSDDLLENPKKMKKMVNQFSSSGKLDLIEFWYDRHRQHNLVFPYTTEAYDQAAKNNHLDVIKWWHQKHKEGELELRYTTRAFDYAAENGCLTILKEMVSYGQPLLYTTNALDSISRMGYLSILEWWETMYVEGLLKLDHTFLAFETSKIDALAWWRRMVEKYDVKMVYDYCVDAASYEGNVEILQWWWDMSADYGIEFKYSENAVDYACNNCCLKSLYWWSSMYDSHGIQIKYSERAISGYTSIHVLNWWISMKNRGFSLKYPSDILAKISYDDARLFNWWYRAHLEEGLEFNLTAEVVDAQSISGSLENLAWLLEYCKQTGIPLPYTCRSVDVPFKLGNMGIVTWWLNRYHDDGYEFRYSENAINGIVTSTNAWVNYIAVTFLDEWKKIMDNNGFPLLYDKDIYSKCKPAVKNWFIKNELVEEEQEQHQ